MIGPARKAVHEALRGGQRLQGSLLETVTLVDRRQDIATPVVIAEDSVAAYLLGEAERNGVEILDDVDVVHVVDAHLAYFEAIGAVGPQAAPDDVIDAADAPDV